MAIKRHNAKGLIRSNKEFMHKLRPFFNIIYNHVTHIAKKYYCTAAAKASNYRVLKTYAAYKDR